MPTNRENPFRLPLIAAGALAALLPTTAFAQEAGKEKPETESPVRIRRIVRGEEGADIGKRIEAAIEKAMKAATRGEDVDESIESTVKAALRDALKQVRVQVQGIPGNEAHEHGDEAEERSVRVWSTIEKSDDGDEPEATVRMWVNGEEVDAPTTGGVFVIGGDEDDDAPHGKAIARILHLGDAETLEPGKLRAIAEKLGDLHIAKTIDGIAELDDVEVHVEKIRDVAIPEMMKELGGIVRLRQMDGDDADVQVLRIGGPAGNGDEDVRVLRLDGNGGGRFEIRTSKDDADHVHGHVHTTDDDAAARTEALEDEVRQLKKRIKKLEKALAKLLGERREV